MQKKILIIANRFPPFGGTGVLRALKFVKYLPEFDCKPYVLTCDYGKAEGFEDHELLKEIPVSAEIIRVKGHEPKNLKQKFKSYEKKTLDKNRNSRRLLKIVRQTRKYIYEKMLIPDFEILWNIFALKTAKKLLEKEKITNIMTTSPPNSVHLLGLKLKKWNHNLNWIADFRDVWTIENDYLSSRNNFVKLLNRRYEKEVLKNCDVALVISDLIHELTAQEFGNSVKRKLHTVTNGYDEADFTYLNKYSPDMDEPVIIFTGSMQKLRANHKLLEGFARYCTKYNDKKTTLKLVGIFDDAVINTVTVLEISERVEIIDFVSHKEAIKYLHEANILAFALANSKMDSLTHTNKFFEYLRSRRPVLCIAPEGVVTNLVRRLGIGHVANPDNSEEIAEAIHAIMEEYPAYEAGTQWKNAEISQFERKNLTGLLVELLQEK